MPKGVYAAASAMRADSRAVDAISHNIANAQTPGFRRAVPIRESFSNAMRGSDDKAAIERDGGAGVYLEGVYHNFNNGQINETGNPLDVALLGTGFLMVQSPDGDLLTRAGHFTRTAAGQLVTPDGWPVLGQGGPIVLPAEASGIEIDKAGRVYAVVPTDIGRERVFVNQMRMVDVEAENLDQLQAINGQYFAADQTLYRDTRDTEILQGRLENANIDPIKELVDMVAVQRRYEAAQKALTTQINNDASYSEILRG